MTAVVEEKLTYFKLDEIWCDEDFNVRKNVTPKSVESLAQDIRRSFLAQNPVVQDLIPGLEDGRPVGVKVKLVAGHRRFNAYKLNLRLFPEEADKWAGIWCKVRPPMTSSEARVMNLKENMERADLNMLEEAHGIEGFKKEGWATLRVAKELGVSKRWVEIRYGLLALPEEIQHRAEANYLTQYQVEECIKKGTRDEQIQYIRNIVDHKERGKKITAENPEEKKKKQKLSALLTKGTTRSMAQMALVQESIQNSFKDIKHPAAMAIAFCMGVISYDEFTSQHIEKWIILENDRRAENNQDPIRFVHSEVISDMKHEGKSY